MTKCSICEVEFDPDTEGVEGLIGMIEFAFCATCKAGIYHWAWEQWIEDD